MSNYSGPTEPYPSDDRFTLLLKLCKSASDTLAASGGNTGEITPPGPGYNGSTIPDMDDNEYMLILKTAASFYRLNNP